MNIPIPPPIAFCKLSGINFISNVLSLVTVMIKLISPQINTMAKASCQVNPNWDTTVYVKNALSPILGAKA